MAEEGSEGSVANSSSTTNLWELHGNNSLSSWNNVISWRPPNPNSNSSCEEDISMSNSFTNTSNHSGLSEDSSRRLMEPNSCRLNEHHDYTRESASDSHLWNQVLLSVGSSGDMGNNQDVGENFLETFPSKNLASVMFEPACDYLKKMDSGWGYANSATLNIERQLNSFNGNFLEPEKLNNLSNLVSNWSIAPPYPDLNRHIIQQPTRDMCLDADYSEPDLSQMKPTLSDSSPYGLVANGNSYFMPSYDMKDIQASDVSLNRPLIKSNNMRNHMSRSNGAVMGDHNKYYYGMADPSQSNTRNLSDVITFNGSLNKPLIDPQASSKPCQKDSNSMESKKQVQDVSLQARGNSRGTGVTSEGKKKRTEDNSETQFKKPKHETVSSVKVQAPKVKLGDRITALQQIVSPFGKTDTASVLQEAIGYIKFLQEQVQLLSNPYMKSNANKDPWGMLERKDKAEMKLDLKSRGLCLVPISCTPQMYRENTGSDYWTPTYRGCLYR